MKRALNPNADTTSKSAAKGTGARHRQGLGHESGRIRYLDVIRALAILSVLAVHLLAPMVPSSLPRVFLGGYIGVDMFYVLSGFIITRILLNRTPAYRAFIWGRARRLFPALLGSLAVGLSIAMLCHSAIARQDSLYSALLGLAMIAPFIQAHRGPSLEPFPVLWSLAIEWYFYLLWPMALRLVRPRAATVALASAVLLYAGSAVFLPTWWFYFGPTSRFAQLLFGCWLATAVTRKAASNAVASLIVTTSVIIVAAWVVVGPQENSDWYRWLGFPLASIATGCLIRYGRQVESLIRGTRVFNALAVIGLLSYSIYLWHLFFYEILPSHAIVGSRPITYAASVLLGLGASLVSYRLFEVRVTRSSAAAIEPQGQISPTI